MTGVQSVGRAFGVLRAVAAGPAGVTELARRVELPTSTVARLLGTLEALGAVSRIDDGVSYRVGPTMADLAAAVDDSAGIVLQARVFLTELARRVGETAGLSVPERDRILYLDHVGCDSEVQVRDWTGTRLPLHVVSSGLVVLAHLAPDELDAYLETPLEVFTPRTVADAVAVRERIEEVRVRGYVWTAEEFHAGITSVAAPVLSRSGAVLGALHCHGPSYRFPSPGDEERIGLILVDVARRLGGRLG
jgi:DNA-binding IclR family transcriptional regulator